MVEDATAEITKTCGAGELEPYFQPIVDVASRRPMGAEAYLSAASQSGAEWRDAVAREAA